MKPQSPRRRGMLSSRALWLVSLLICPLATSASGQPSLEDGSPNPLKVRLEVARGPHYVGAGIDLAVSVLAGDVRPALDLPEFPQGELWIVESTFRPVAATGIGEMEIGQNVFVTRLRLVARRSGVLEIPPFVARVDGRSGRAPVTRLSIETVPLQGRPAGFLGGVGDFSVRAVATSESVAVGQELQYRIEVEGPAVWGMTSRPELDRLGQLAIDPVVEPLSDEEVREPPSRSFLWRLRPTRAGTVVLPPVSISAFDPRTRRFITKVSQGVPIKAVAVPLIDPKMVEYLGGGENQETLDGPWRWAAGAMFVMGAAAAWVLTTRYRAASRTGFAAARGHARAVALKLTSESGESHSSETGGALARRIIAELATYGRIGLGTPNGALTPDEAQRMVRQMTGSEELAARAASLCDRCDRVLFSERGREAAGVASLWSEARGLFSALGKAEAKSSRTELSGSTSRMSD